MQPKINGVWRNTEEMFVKVNNVWRTVEEEYIKVDGVWRLGYENKTIKQGHTVNSTFTKEADGVVLSVTQSTNANAQVNVYYNKQVDLTNYTHVAFFYDVTNIVGGYTKNVKGGPSTTFDTDYNGMISYGSTTPYATGTNNSVSAAVSSFTGLHWLKFSIYYEGTGVSNSFTVKLKRIALVNNGVYTTIWGS